MPRFSDFPHQQWAWGRNRRRVQRGQWSESQMRQNSQLLSFSCSGTSVSSWALCWRAAHPRSLLHSPPRLSSLWLQEIQLLVSKNPEYEQEIFTDLCPQGHQAWSCASQGSRQAEGAWRCCLPRGVRRVCCGVFYEGSDVCGHGSKYPLPPWPLALSPESYSSQSPSRRSLKNRGSQAILEEGKGKVGLTRGGAKSFLLLARAAAACSASDTVHAALGEGVCHWSVVILVWHRSIHDHILTEWQNSREMWDSNSGLKVSYETLMSKGKVLAMRVKRNKFWKNI